MNERAQQILKFIESYSSKEGRPPTIREIGTHFKIASTNGVRYYLTMLEKSNHLERTRMASRGIRSTASRRPPAGIPILGRVAAGPAIFAESNQEGTLPLGEVFGDPAGLYALRVRGDSMIDAGILAGDYVIVRHTETARAGEIIVALLEDEATVKYFRPRGDHVELVAANPNYQPIQVTAESGFRISGVVTGVLRTINNR
jgi:repressor LexA